MTSPSKSTPVATTTTASTNCSPERPIARPTCRYAGKRCFNPRAVKRNGSLHNLCHEHRVRANQNQRRMELKRRLARSHEDNSKIEVSAALFSGFSAAGGALSSSLGIVDIDVHLGWIPSPPPLQSSPFASSYHAMSLYHQQQHYLPQYACQSRMMQPDYTLSATVGSVLLDDDNYTFTDLDSNGASTKDAIWSQDLQHASQEFEMYTQDDSSGAATALELQQTQQDMWIVPNFLLSL